MKKQAISTAQKEVWSWKEDCYLDVAHLGTAAAINKRIHDAVETVKGLGLYTVDATIRPHAMIAEEPATYGKG